MLDLGEQKLSDGDQVSFANGVKLLDTSSKCSCNPRQVRPGDNGTQRNLRH
jgi:hypothetical protein